MPVKITINLFSGRKSPSFSMSDSAARKLIDNLSIGRFKKRTLKTTPFPDVLGYRGITIEQGGKKIIADLPDKFYLTHDSIFTADSVAATDKSAGLDAVIFDNLGNIRDFEDIKKLKGLLERKIPDFLQKRDIYIKNYFINYEMLLEEFYGRPRISPCYCAPVPDLDNWNINLQVSANNCYNYSTNYRTDTFAQPGQASGLNITVSSCNPSSGNSVKAGAIADGLVDLPNNNNTCPRKGHLVALVIDPNSDYHWFRKGPTGKWSHKPGQTPATILDNSGLPITDPRTADRGGYTEFCTFMQVIHGHFKIK